MTFHIDYHRCMRSNMARACSGRLAWRMVRLVASRCEAGNTADMLYAWQGFWPRLRRIYRLSELMTWV
jgi:hypothetical protein